MSKLPLPLLLSLLIGSPAAAAEPGEAVQISFSDLLVPGPRLTPSPKLAALAGRRVRMVGFMAELEAPPRGAFYLTARPVRCDEGGGGTGDLPPDAVRVIVRSASDQEIPFYPGAIEVAGVLDLGAGADEEGRPSSFRITLDRPEDIGRSTPASPRNASPRTTQSRRTTPNGGQVP
jgi:hypothetical protein